MAGDAQNDAIDKKNGAKDAPPTTVLHINLVDLSGGDTKPQAAQPVTPKEFPLQLAQSAVGMNGRHTGPTSQNPYEAPGGGVAPAYQVGGKRPQDGINQPGTTPSAAADWNDPAAQAKRQAALDAIAADNQAKVKAAGDPNAAKPGNGAVIDPGHAADGTAVHHLGGGGLLKAAMVSIPFAQWVHPLLQRVGVPAQLAADTRLAEGKMTPLGKIVDYVPKAYLKAFSPTYIAQSELARIVPVETAAKDHLAAVKTTAEESLEALKMKKADVANLKTVAAGTPTTDIAKAEKARAERQLDYLARQKASGITTRKAIEDETKKISFLEKNDTFVAGGTVPEKGAASLNWTGLTQKMKEANVFSTADMTPVAQIAGKEEPYISIAGKMMGRGELEAITKATEAGKGFWGTGWSLGKKLGVPLAIVGTESLAQIAAARALGDNDNATFGDHIKNDVARIIEPTVPGAIAKDLALMLGADKKTKLIAFGGAQLYESESNMTHLERIGTMIAGLAPAAIALAKENKEVAVGLAVADAGIGLAAEITSDFWFKDDKSLSTAAKAITDVSKDPKDISHGTLKDGVKELMNVGKDDPFLLTSIYDQAHTPAAEPKKNDSPLVMQAKYKQQLLVGQAQGETILDNGLTKSQYIKMQNRDAAIPDPPDHKEDYRIAPSQKIDIGGQATRTLIGAIGSANLLEWAASQTPGSDTSGVEKQKQDMKNQLQDLLTKPHQGQIENALKDSTWGFGKSVNDYDLVQFWKHNNDDYAHINTLIRDTANYYATVLPTMQQNLNNAQGALEQAKTNPASATDAAQKQHLFDARQDALGLTTLWVGKLYRDEALMKLGQVQYMLEDNHDGHTVDPRDITPQLQLVATALQNSQKYAPGNPDEKILESMTVKMYKAANLIPPTNFQPNTVSQ
jgi:hypothetical protein